MNQFTRDKQRRLVELLYKKTVNQEIKWHISSEKQIYAMIAKRPIYLTSGLNGEGEDLIIFNMYAEDGSDSDSFTDESLVYDQVVPVNFQNWYLLCAAILEIGKRQASGADDTLDAMIAELDDDDVPF